MRVSRKEVELSSIDDADKSGHGEHSGNSVHESASEDYSDEESVDDSESDLKDLEGDEYVDQKLADELGKTMSKEVAGAVYSARYLGPFLAFLGLLLAHRMTVTPYNINILDRQFSRVQDLSLVRPVLSNQELHSIQENTRNGETNLQMPLPSYDQIKLRFHSSATPKGTHQLPELFYKGVVFGLTDENSHDLKYTGRGTENNRRLASDKNENVVDEQLKLSESELHLRLKNMRPKPTAIMQRSVQNNQTNWSESGYAVYFSFDDLEAQGKISSDKLKPWKRVLEDVMHIAREQRQVYITAWYPHVFGEQDEKTKKLGDPYRYTTIIQQIMPTRTGMYELGSTVPVWMSALNHTLPDNDKRTSHVIRKVSPNFSILLASNVMLSAVLDSSGVILSYSILPYSVISLAYHISTILIYPL